MCTFNIKVWNFVSLFFVRTSLGCNLYLKRVESDRIAAQSFLDVLSSGNDASGPRLGLVKHSKILKQIN